MKKNWLLGLSTVLGGWTATAQIHPHILQGKNPAFELIAPRTPSGFLLDQHLFPYYIEKGNDSNRIFNTNQWYDGAQAIRQITPISQPSFIPSLERKEMLENAVALNLGVNTLSLVDFEMNQIDTLAYSDGRLFPDTLGRWVPNYWGDTSYFLPFHAQFAGITAFQPPYDAQRNRYRTILQWVLPDSNIYHRGNGLVENIEMNFFDGRGWISITPNVVFTSDLQLMNHPGYLLIRWGNPTNPTVRRLALGLNYQKVIEMNQYLPTQTIHWSSVQAFNGGKVHPRSGEARMYHFSPTEDTLIRKPVVFVEGYDPSPNEEALRYGSIGANLRSGFISSVYSTDTFNSYVQLSGFRNLADSILALGFDLILVDFRNGADEIEANAQALASCLGYLQALPYRSSEMLIIGASMGGLTSRYALKKLENAGIRHCVGTWVSFDSPHLGANIPLNYQALLEYMGFGSYTAKKKFQQNVMVPAAMQMLVNHIDSNGSAPQMRSNWNQKQFQVGFPTKTKNVGITNGATNGHLYPLYPNEKNFNYDYKSQFNAQCWVNDTTQNNQRVMHAKINRLVQPHYAQNLDRADQQYYEFTPGGLGETGSDLLDGLNEAFGTSVQFDRREYEKHSFIPAQSALFDYSNAPTASMVGRPNAVFQVVVHLADTNETHVTVNQRTSNPLYALLMEMNDSFPRQLPNPSGSQFNLTETSQMNHDLTVQNGGLMLVNGYRKKNYGNQYDSPKVVQNVQVSFSNCGHTWLVQRGGMLQIGEQNSSAFPNNAKVVFSAGSILELQSGAILKIEDYSELVFEPGAMLRMHPSARIELNGTHALLSVNSIISLADSTTFELFGTGKMEYRVDSSICSAILVGKGCTWKMNSQVHLEVTDGSQLELPSNLYLAQFDSSVTFLGHSATVIIQSPCIMKDSKFTSGWNGNGTHRGVQIFATAASVLHRNTFENGQRGLVIFQKSANQSAKILRCQFLNNTVGLEAVGKGTRCYQNTFRSNQVGYKGRDAEMATLLDGNQFQNNQVAIDFLGQNTAALYLQGNSILGNHFQVGVQAQSSQSVFACNQFAGLGICLTQKFGHLELGRGAANVFQGKVGINLDEVATFKLSGGLNDFSGIQDALLDGVLTDSFAFQWSNGVPILRVDSNSIPSRLLLNPPFYQTSHPFAFWSNRNAQFIPAFTAGNQLTATASQCRGAAQQAQTERLVDRLSGMNTTSVVSSGQMGQFSQLLMELILETQWNNDSALQMQSLHQLLQLMEDRPTSNANDDAMAIELAEKLAMNWLAMAYEDQLLRYNRAQFGTQPNSTVQQLVDILEELKQEQLMVSDLESASAFDLEKAQVFRLAEHYDYAQHLLSQLSSQASTIQLAESDYWSCVCRAEEQFISGNLFRLAFEDSLQACRSQLPALRKRHFSFENTTNQSTPVGVIYSNGSLLISGGSLGDHFRIMDVQGRTVHEGKINASSISNLELPPGLYFFVTSQHKLTLMVP